MAQYLMDNIGDIKKRAKDKTIGEKIVLFVTVAISFFRNIPARLLGNIKTKSDKFLSFSLRSFSTSYIKLFIL